MSVAGKLQEAIEVAEAVHARLSRESLLYYLQTVRINAQPDPKPFGQVAEWWQRQLLRPKVPAFEYLAGLTYNYTGPLSFFDVLARGHDKSSLEGRIATWLLLASRRIVHGYIIAADRDQGRLILQAMEDELRLNSWVARLITVQRNVVKGPAGEVEVLPADAASAYGLRGNLFICDEVTHWKNRKMWNAIISGRQKVTPSILCVLSNAGLQGSWQHEAFRKARANELTKGRWATFYKEGFLAGWVNKAELADMMEQLPPSEADRLYGNKWIDPAADKDYLRRPEVAACLDDTLFYRLAGDPRVGNYIATLDYGPKKDRTVLCVMHLDESRTVVIDRMDVLTGDVKVERVEALVQEVERLFHPKLWVCDPYQMLGTIEWMEDKLHLRVERWAARGGSANFEMAQTLRSFVVGGQVRWYPGCGRTETPDKVSGEPVVETLGDELCGLVTKKMPYGYRFDHENQKHDDRAVALAMGLVRVNEFPHHTIIPVRSLAEGYSLLHTRPTP